MELTNKLFEDDIYYYLTNKAKINRISFLEPAFKENVKSILPAIEENEEEFKNEACAYIMGKAAEMAILEVCRPDFSRVWVTPEEIHGDIVMNLPEHLVSIVVTMMDGCENALETYLNENEDDIKELMIELSFVAEMLVKKYKIFDYQIEGFSNKDIAFPSEVYNFANSIVLKELELTGYKVVGYEPNFNSPVNIVLERDGETYTVLESVTVDPIRARFVPYLRKITATVAKNTNSIPCCLGVMVSSKNDRAREMGVVTLADENNVRRTELIKL